MVLTDCMDCGEYEECYPCVCCSDEKKEKYHYVCSDCAENHNCDWEHKDLEDEEDAL